MTKSELAAKVAAATGHNINDVIGIISATNNAIMQTLASGEGVYMRGFGSFIPKVRKQKVARNISAGTQVIVPEHTIPIFKPAPDFKESVSQYHE